MDAEFTRSLGRILRAGVVVSGAMVLVGLVFLGPRVVTFGIYALIATPILRVAAIGAYHARKGEWSWAGICALVLAMIAASAALGVRH